MFRSDRDRNSSIGWARAKRSKIMPRHQGRGRDYYVGDRPWWSIDDANRRAADYEAGRRTPNFDDVACAVMKLKDGGYPDWEDREARVILATAQRNGIPIPRSQSAEQIRRWYGQ